MIPLPRENWYAFAHAFGPNPLEKSADDDDVCADSIDHMRVCIHDLYWGRTCGPLTISRGGWYRVGVRVRDNTCAPAQRSARPDKPIEPIGASGNGC